MRERRKKEEMPPKDHPTFVKHWEIYIHSILANPNYQPMHLMQLGILCDLHVEYERLQAILDLVGYTYEAEGRYGKQVKTRPEVNQMAQITRNISTYSRILGLGLGPQKPSAGLPQKPKAGDEEWD